MKTYIFDIDGTICSNTNGEYQLAEPYKERIDFINKLYNEGNTIKYFTARGSTTGINWYELTENQLLGWGALHHELILNKPDGDIYIDDKAFNCNQWLFPSQNTPNNNSENKSFFKGYIQNHIEVMNKLLTDQIINKQIDSLCLKIKETFKKGGKLIFAGNGGSFSDSQHLVAEFVCRFSTDRIPLPAIALGTNSSNLTAIGNDYGFEYVFSRELESLGNHNDLLIAFTTSGNSENIVNLIEKAKSIKIPFYILTGQSGGKLSRYRESTIKAPSEETAIIQQIHIVLGHIICQNVEIPYI
ncbi:SIS domain-containing protein [Prochlorococcus sp. MIT 1223]|uniref:D-sedoheptulose-7-phosphate isomerase n=1 Tax=Prochlorococcus sp. MIT 1223 TaxID=3096217 RepID=UPI002A74A4EF|nr:SIS domain-containing protein [Prochlorococcus sp. MIT 1223]